MSFLDKIKNIVNVDEDGYYPDDDIDTGAFISSDSSFDEPEEKVVKPQRRAVRNSDDSKVVNIHTTAQLQVVLSKPEKFEETVKAIKAIPEIVECHFTTGPYTAVIKLYARDNAHLMELVNGKIQEIKGVSSTETLGLCCAANNPFTSCSTSMANGSSSSTGFSSKVDSSVKDSSIVKEVSSTGVSSTGASTSNYISFYEIECFGKAA